MQAESARARLPVLTSGMIDQSRVQFPVQTIVIADPEAGRVNADIDGSRFAGPSWFNNPDVVELFAAVLWKLNTALRFLPGLPEVITETQVRAEKVAVFCREQALTTALVKGGIENTTTFQHRSLDFPGCTVAGSQKKQTALRPDH